MSVFLRIISEDRVPGFATAQSWLGRRVQVEAFAGNPLGESRGTLCTGVSVPLDESMKFRLESRARPTAYADVDSGDLDIPRSRKDGLEDGCGLLVALVRAGASPRFGWAHRRLLGVVARRYTLGGSRGAGFGAWARTERRQGVCCRHCCSGAASELIGGLRKGMVTAVERRAHRLNRSAAFSRLVVGRVMSRTVSRVAQARRRAALDPKLSGGLNRRASQGTIGSRRSTARRTTARALATSRSTRG